MKKELRKKQIAFLKNLASKPEKELREKVVLNEFLASEIFQQAQTIAVFLPENFEFNVTPIFSKAWEKKKTLVAPQAKNKEMTFYPFTNKTTFQRSSFGVLEPPKSRPVTKEEIDLVVVPGLIFNESGYRIGFGGGFYDRFLEDYQGKTVSFAFKESKQTFTPKEHDIPVAKVWFA